MSKAELQAALKGLQNEEAREKVQTKISERREGLARARADLASETNDAKKVKLEKVIRTLEDDIENIQAGVPLRSRAAERERKKASRAAAAAAEASGEPVTKKKKRTPAQIAANQAKLNRNITQRVEQLRDPGYTKHYCYEVGEDGVQKKESYRGFLLVPKKGYDREFDWIEEKKKLPTPALKARSETKRAKAKAKGKATPAPSVAPSRVVSPNNNAPTGGPGGNVEGGRRRRTVRRRSASRKASRKARKSMRRSRKH